MWALIVALVQVAQPALPVQKTPGVRGYSGPIPLRYERPLSEQLVLTAQMGKRSYEVGEPAEVVVVATNASREPVLCHCPLRFGAIVIEYRRAGEPFRVLEAESSRYPEMFALYQLEPGEAVRATTRVSYDRSKEAPPFDEPGRYEMRVMHYDSPRRSPESRIVSEPYFFEVVPPGDPEAWKAYRGELALLVQRSGGGVPTDGILRQAAGFLETFEDSVYAPSVQRAFSSMLRWRLYDEHGRLRDDATEEYRALFERYRPRPQDPVPIPARRQ